MYTPKTTSTKTPPFGKYVRSAIFRRFPVVDIFFTNCRLPSCRDLQTMSVDQACDNRLITARHSTTERYLGACAKQVQHKREGLYDSEQTNRLTISRSEYKPMPNFVWALQLQSFIYSFRFSRLKGPRKFVKILVLQTFFKI